MEKVLILSDDLTGACNSASYFINNSKGISVYININNINKKFISSLKKEEVVVLNTNTRTENRNKAYKSIKELSKLIPSFDDRVIIKKVDTALRGNIEVELKAMIETLDNNKLYFIINSIPSMGRITVGGFQIINGRVLEDTEFKNSPYEKIRSSFISDILGNNLKSKSGLIYLQDIRRSLDVIGEKIKNYSCEKKQILIFDSASEEDIDNTITAAFRLFKSVALEKILWIGSLGLIASLSRYLIGRKNFKTQNESISEDDSKYNFNLKIKSKKIFGISASMHEKVKNQIENAEKLGFIKIIRININKFLRGDCSEISVNSLNKDLIGNNFLKSKKFKSNLEINAELIKSELKNNNIFIIPEVGVNIRQKRIEKLILKILSDILKKLFFETNIAAEIYRLILIGGETSFYVLKELNTNILQINGSIENGIDYGLILDGLLINKKFSIKGGSVGDENSVIKMICLN